MVSISPGSIVWSSRPRLHIISPIDRDPLVWWQLTPDHERIHPRLEPRTIRSGSWSVFTTTTGLFVCLFLTAALLPPETYTPTLQYVLCYSQLHAYILRTSHKEFTVPPLSPSMLALHAEESHVFIRNYSFKFN
jgi:hypothetical protein